MVSAPDEMSLIFSSFCVWVKTLGNDFSKELTKNSNITLT